MLTGRGDAVVRALVILLALVGGREEVIAAEGLGAGLALEREEVDEAAEGGGALPADVEEGVVAPFVGSRDVGHRRC